MGWFRRSTQKTEVEQISNPLFGADTQQQELQDSQLRSPAGLEQLTTNEAHASTSTCPSRVSGTRDHAPAVLVLPADGPLASSSSDNLQGLAGDSCVWTPGTVGPDSPPGPLHVPAGHCKSHASTPKPAHRLSSPAGAQHASTSTGQAAQGHSSRVSWQDHPGQWSGSSSGSWTAGSTASPCSPAAAAGETAAQTPPQAPRSRPTSAIQRHVQLQLQQQQQQQQQQQRSSSSADSSTAAAGAADEDELFADMCACLDNLQAAAQLARTESALISDKLPAAIAAVRASFDESRRTSSSRPSSAGAAPQAASSAGSTAGVLRASNGGGCGVRSSIDGSGAAAATSGGSFSGDRQLARGRSRLQASTSNACLAEEEVEEEDSFCHLVLERGPSILRHSSTCTGTPVEPLLMVTVGPDGASVPPTEQRKLPMVQARPSSGSSGASAGTSAGVGSSCSSSSSQRSSMDKGSRSSGSAPDSPASLTHTRPPPPKAAESLQEQQERQRLQELRQQKQEQVVASYGCPSPHSPSRASQSGHSHLGSSRPCSGRDAGTLHSPAPDRQQQQHVGGAGRISSSGPCGSAGAAAPAVAFDATHTLQPASLSDAWAAVQAGAPKAAGTVSLRPPSASVAGSLQVPLPPRMLSAGAAQSPRAAKAAPAATASLGAAAAAQSYQ